MEDVPGDRVMLMVTDTGKGIAEDKLAHVFSPFDRLGAEQTSIEGTGLGLTLSKLLVEAMGGTLGVESEPWVGSTFMVGLRASEATDAEPESSRGNGRPAVAADDSTGATILYIEDNLSNFKLVERLLGPRGNVRLLAAMDGSLGFELARQHRPDLILLDLHLPIMEGEEVLLRLKDDPVTGEIPVVVVSADATAAKVETLLAMGATAFLTKPIEVKRFTAIVDDALSGRIAV
jgi:CheY-like chemotaxis protein